MRDLKETIQRSVRLKTVNNDDRKLCPLTTIDEYNTFEDNILMVHNRQSLVNQLARIGDQNVKECCSQILKASLDKNLQTKLNQFEIIISFPLPKFWSLS